MTERGRRLLLGALAAVGALGAQLLPAGQTPLPESWLEPTPCWFEAGYGWPRHECYYFHVPEDHDAARGRYVAFPLLVFRAPEPDEDAAPVLHLGGGGPGAPVYLDYSEGVRTLWEYHDDMSLEQGRDLYVMDPRGTGLAKPLLTCQRYVDNVIGRWQRNLGLEQEWREVDADYLHCFDELRTTGVDFSAYNSLAIARDVERLRRVLGVRRWVLIGVSYGSIYAQSIVREYPDSVESMILDSAAFPHLRPHEHFRESTMAPYEALYGYCDADPDCATPVAKIEERLWALVERLDEEPLPTRVVHPYEGTGVEVLLNGHRFVESLLNATYDERIFSVLPDVIADLEEGRPRSIAPFVEDYLGYLLDDTYGDVSASCHYCYETRPFTDLERMREAARDLPPGYIRETALLSIDWPDYCEALAVKGGEERLGMPVETAVPTLFLHGELDPVTRLADVRAVKPLFSRSVLITYPLSHDVLGSEACAETVAAKFIADPTLAASALTCP